MNLISNKEAERRRKISETMKGMKKTPEHIAKVAAANTGKKRSKEVCEKFRINAIKQFSNPANVEKTRKAALRQWADPEKRKRGEEANREVANRSGQKEKISKALKKLWQNKEYREKMILTHKGQTAWNKGVSMTPAYRKNMIKAINKPEVLAVKRKKSKALWRDKNYVKKIQASYHCKPNKPESILLNLLNNIYPNEWKYTGDFSLIINGKSPDFVNCNGKKLIIEMFGDYWHKGERAKDRALCFEPLGYKTLVIWESELNDINNVANKIKSFVRGAEQ